MRSDAETRLGKPHDHVWVQYVVVHHLNDEGGLCCSRPISIVCGECWAEKEVPLPLPASEHRAEPHVTRKKRA